ncbi:hypothetical protein HZC31_02280 [Candidatus Woesearchaeota archaeon]|nr:hypothetical protein [Candidatus Woesearchaeota archaeon]
MKIPPLTGSNNMHWKTPEAGVLFSKPGFITSGYDMRILALARGKTYHTEKGFSVIVNMLRGSISIGAQMLAAVPEKRYDIAQYHSSTALHAEEESLAFLCYERSSGEVYEPLSGLEMKWIEPAPGCHRTDPKIEVDGIRINLWYLVPNKNGGIHNHAENQGHNIGDSNVQFVEWHTQLRGNGWMVKYHSQNEGTEYERIPMKIGHAHPLFSTVEKGVIHYPWHAYVTGDQGALFVAFEDTKIRR